MNRRHLLHTQTRRKVILDQEGRVLLVRHTYGRLNWDLPGGAAEADESVEGAAVREVMEETGLHVVVDRMIGRIYCDPGVDMHHFLFLCRPVAPEAAPIANSPEISECGYWPVEALPRPISDFTIRRIRDVRAAHMDGVDRLHGYIQAGS